MALQRLDDLFGYEIEATDGNIGKITNVLFDDMRWEVRYLVVETGNWLSNRQVLVSPLYVSRWNSDTKTVLVSLTQEEVRESPDVNTDLPVSRQEERKLSQHYRPPVYWGRMGGLAGMGMVWPAPSELMPETEATDDNEEKTGDKHLRSAREVIGYRIDGRDGDVGKVTDFIINDQWRMEYLIVETGNWLIGKQVLLPRQYVSTVSWESKEIQVKLTRDVIKLSPPYENSTALNRTYEARLFMHYMQGAVTRVLEHRGKPVINATDGRYVGTFLDVYLDSDAQHIVGVLLAPEGLLHRSQSVVKRDAIVVMGPDVWLIKDTDSVLTKEEFEAGTAYILADDFRGREIQTEGSTPLGVVDDVILNTEGKVQSMSLRNVFVQGPLATSKRLGRAAITSLGSKDTPMTTILMKAEEFSA